MTELRECPNPECRSALVLLCLGEHLEVGPAKTERLIECQDCGMWGPAGTEAEAARLWNALPRQSDLEQLRARIAELDPPWVRIGDGLPQDPYSWDIALRDGSVRTNLAWDRYYEFFHDGGPNAWTSAEVSHYRRHTTPKHPESK
jgi:hypothetical protein